MTSYENVIIGLDAGKNALCSNTNTFIGNCSGKFNIGSLQNTLIGTNTGKYNKKSKQNTCAGHDSGANMQGNTNTFIGYKSGINVHGDSNIIIGSYTETSNISDNIIIGSNLTSNIDKSIMIGQDDALISGQMNTKHVNIHGNLEVQGKLTTNSLCIPEMNALPYNGQLAYEQNGNIVSLYIGINNQWIKMCESSTT